MSLHASDRVYQALAALRNDLDFEVVRDWLENELLDQREKNDVAAADHVLRQGQGRAQVLKEFLDAAREAREVVARQR